MTARVSKYPKGYKPLGRGTPKLAPNSCLNKKIMLTKSELLELWREYGFRPVKRLGQNFLIDKNIRDKILRKLEVGANDRVIEIGPGFGELTVSLAAAAKEVFAIEKDRNIVRALKETNQLPGNARLIEQDFLDTDFKKIAGGKKVIVYGNLPYYITSPAIEKLIKNISFIKAVYLVLQQEVAERILARAGDRKIGRLSLYVQYYAKPTKMFCIRKGSFYPAPKVDSAFLRLDIRKDRKGKVKNEALLFEIIKKAYGKRRKTVLNSLSGPNLKKDRLRSILKSANINPSARPETLSLDDFIRFSNLLGAKQQAVWAGKK